MTSSRTPWLFLVLTACLLSAPLPLWGAETEITTEQYDDEPRYHQSEPEPEPEYRGYDRLAILYPAAGFMHLMWRVPTTERGGAGGSILSGLGIKWRPTDRLGFGTFFEIGFPLISGRAGVVGAYAPAGWDRSGVILSTGLYIGRMTMGCPDGEYCPHGSSGVGPQLSVDASYRWSLGEGGWGIRLGIAGELAWLEEEFDEFSGLHIGVSGPRFILDW